MSATGRTLRGGPATERAVHDQYETPEWATRLILSRLSTRIWEANAQTSARVLEPACGTGAITRILLEHDGFYAKHVTGVDVDPTMVVRHEQLGVHTKCLDFVTSAPDYSARGFRFDLIITNPPYKLAEAYARAALPLLSAQGELALLLRLNFLAGQKRSALHREHPSDVYVLPRRPSFTGNGTDATEYAWLVWGPGRGNRWFLLDEGNGA